MSYKKLAKTNSVNDLKYQFDKNNYETACEKIKEAMQKGEKFIYLPGKNGSTEFTWAATRETIERLRTDGFNIDVEWDPWEYWSIEWGY